MKLVCILCGVTTYESPMGDFEGADVCDSCSSQKVDNSPSRPLDEPLACCYSNSEDKPKEMR